MRNTPFHLVPWSDDFLLRLRQLIDEATGNQPGDAVVVFPLNRPKRYLVDLYKQDLSAPLLLPKIINSGQLTDLCLESWTESPLRRAGILDQAAIVRDCVLAAADNSPSGSGMARLAESIRNNGMARFFPWGLRLAAILEECAGHLVQASDLTGIEDEVAEYAAILLGNLQRIQMEYHSRLEAAGLCTSGTQALRAAREALKNPSLPTRLKNRKIILAGFVRLTVAQNVLFRYLWEHGALVCLHTDHALASGRHHWSCEDHAEWLHQWNADAIPYGHPSKRNPRLHYYAGYDLHSQLRELRARLEDSATAEGQRAVVLSHDALLMPALHHIPEKQINISLGYPLARSLLARLIERIFQLREGMDSSGRVRWKDLLALLRHPYVRMLRTPGTDGGRGLAIRPFLSLLEKKVRTGSRMVHAAEAAAELADDVLGDLEHPPVSEDVCEDTARLLELVSARFAGQYPLCSLKDLAAMLHDISDILLTYGSEIWPLFPLDAECLSRLTQEIIPELHGNAMADEPLDLASLLSIARRRLAEERVAFDADPLTGLQILGTLETRLLHFESVSFLDLTDDALPGSPQSDPLLPDSLRPLIGLPDNSSRERLAAHTFHRLIQGARDVFLYWQEGVKTGSLDGKKQRSRFIDELLWEQEKRSRKLVQPGGDGYGVARFPISLPPLRTDIPVERTDAIDESVRNLLRKAVSPTMLDTYLSCPMKFFLQRVCGLRKPETIPDGDDPLGLGNALHKSLFKTYQPFLGRPVLHGDITHTVLTSNFMDELNAAGLLANLPPQSCFMLEHVGPKRLRDYLEKQPDVLRLLALETTLSAPVRTHAGTFHLEGTIDRIDLREDGVRILDYKSGRTSRQPKAGFWNDAQLWEQMELWIPGAPDPLPQLANILPSAQLACYLSIWTASGMPGSGTEDNPDAAWVQLADGGGEIPFFGSMDADERRQALETKIPTLIGFLFRHIATAPFFPHRRTIRCEHCDFRSSCRT